MNAKEAWENIENVYKKLGFTSSRYLKQQIRIKKLTKGVRKVKKGVTLINYSEFLENFKAE